MTYINCRHCPDGKPIGAAGLKGHLAAAHNITDYAGELKALGIERNSYGNLVRTGEVAPKRKYTKHQPEEPRTLTITSEAMAIALTGLERIQADLNRHVEDVRAQLNGPTRKTRALTDPGPWPELAKPKDWISNEPLTEVDKTRGLAVAKELNLEKPKLLWTGGRHWSNDPDNRYRHHTDGTLRLDHHGNPQLRPKHRRGYRGGPKGSANPTENALRMRQRRALAKAKVVNEGVNQQ